MKLVGGENNVIPLSNPTDAEELKRIFELYGKNIAGVVSQVLILGSIDKEGKVILVHPSQKSENGLPIA